ncbi:helix-turn-helix domain-containing protein [Streptomyces flaveolus]|uniref:helix-turn-helix domain-containing protein n=1 Tax=Streptomyces flaveolus TaxID=67297 RepID=UPI0036F8F870
MTTGRIELASTGRTVAANVKRLREAQRLTLRALSARLKEMGRPLSADALNKIENGASDEPRQVRRVDVDDLVALAVALGVHPTALLLPPTARISGSGGEPVTVPVTGAGDVPARVAWEWAHGMRPLPREGEDPERSWLQFSYAALPEGWRGMPAATYAQWDAEQARQDYERILGLTGFNADGTRKDGGDDG